MRNTLKIGIKTFVLLLTVLMLFSRFDVAAGNDTPNAVLKAMEEEMARSMKNLGHDGNPAPYFISHQVTESQKASISASFGALMFSNQNHNRLLYSEVRVGSRQLDNTHPLRGSRTGYGADYIAPVRITTENDPDAIKADIWMDTDARYKAAVKQLIQIKTNKGVTVKEEDQSDDFSQEEPRQDVREQVTISPDIQAWEKKIREYSAMFNGYPEIYYSEVTLRATAENKYFVNSEGTRLLHGRTHWRISIYARTKAEDGMELYKSEAFDARTQGKLPDDQTVYAAVKTVINELLALRQAPLMEPYTGPAILSGRASAVFFHEIFGHRVEGHRQKDETEGQTFTKRINKEVLPNFISVYDDPGIDIYDNVDLNGHYLYDDEGVKAQRVNLVQNGILKNFLMSRSPIKGFPNSNGHGRSQAGYRAVGRMGNLVVEAHKTVSKENLRDMLIKECKAQAKPYGLYFDDISGGFTRTRRYSAQSFNVTPIMVYRVYVDGRPDELVRGVSLIGTPLTSFSKIIACGSDSGIFNGYCGAESGSIPASAISPSLLTTQIEVQKTMKSSNKPPVLSPPTRTDTALLKNRDPIIAAMKDELARSMGTLKIENMEKPYYLQYSLTDRQRLGIGAVFGAIAGSGVTKQRLLKVGLRVGDYKLDNTRFLNQGGLYSLVMSPSGTLTLDNDYNVIRHGLWLVTDKAYKQTLEELAAKTAYIKNQVQSENIPDFSREKPVQAILPRKTIDLKQYKDKWQVIIKKLSVIFRDYPAIHESQVELEVKLDHKYYVNSEGSVYRQPEMMATLLALATTQSADGMRLTHHRPFYATSIEDLPPERELTAEIRKMAEQLTALSEAPVMENYIGPVLFTKQAAAELFAQVLAPHFSGQRPPLSDLTQMASVIFTSRLVQRVNRRVLPRNLSISADPTRKTFAGKPLIGSYEVDEEGVAAQAVQLVGGGILKNLLMSRIPRKDRLNSNGHGRAPYVGNAGAQISNLVISAEKGKTFKQLKKELMELCRYQKLPYGMIITAFDDPSITGREFSMSTYMMDSGQTDRMMTAPVLIYKVDTASGREELVRGLVISELDVRELKHMTAAGSDANVHHRMMPPGGGIMSSLYLYRSRGSMGIPASIVAPSVLFEEIEFKKSEEKRDKLPYLPHPFFNK